MVWQKKGRIFDPTAHDWAGSHAQVPAVLIKDDVLRIYYADRNADGKSFPTFIDVERNNPANILYYHKESVLPYGKPGTFDDEGVMPGFVMHHEGKIWMYYSGWNQRVTVPYHNATGLAVSEDGGDSFMRLYEGPILDRTPEEPYLAVTPTVISDGGRWLMWYVSGLRWEEIDGKYEPVYVIKYANSLDGKLWMRPNFLCIKQKHDLEAFSHPSVIRMDGIFCMWFSYRDSADFRDGVGSYRMGYAESKDGVKWERKDAQAGIDVSPDGWDSTMICYPYVIEVDGTLYLFYNGNGFGQSGLGYAVWQE